MNSPGYNTAETQLITAITNNGHTVVVNSTMLNTLPAGFTSTCIDSINGYDWLCFFGDNDFTTLLPQIQNFINTGGKVFYQYEVSCCTVSSNSIAVILSGLTGLTITPNTNAAVAGSSTPGSAGWNASINNCCTTSFLGNAYKGLDGLPLINQFQAASNLNSSSPPVSACFNFGFYFTTTDFVGIAHKGAIVGIGDVNIWYNGDEPFSNGGSTPVNTTLVDYFFPGTSSSCYLFPQGCLESYYPQTVNLNLGNDTTLCTGETLTLDAMNPGAVYLWQDNSSNPTFTVTQQGTYWVKVSNNCGTASDTIHVSYGPPPAVNLANDTTLCQGETLLLNAGVANVNYLWQDHSSNSTFTVNHQGTYWVEVTNNCGSASDTVHISYNALPSVNLIHDTVLCLGNTLTLNASFPNANYLWQDHSSGPTFTVTQQGTYWVDVSTGCGSVSDTIEVGYQDCEIILEMPNVFTPNRDGLNDYFHPIEIKGIVHATLIIYNRWGNKLFETDDMNTGWNGKFNKRDCSDGTYYWILLYTDINNESSSKNGSLTLIR